MDELTGGDAIVGTLFAMGVEVVFGIPSVHNLPIYDSLRRHGRIRAVTVRHEQAAAGAADAYARVTGRLGVFITSTGPGAANAMGGQLEAFVSSSPVVHVTGQIDSRYLDEGRGFIHEVPDQPAMLGSLAKWTGRAASVEHIPARISDALIAASAHPQGPAAVEIPIDFQYASYAGRERTAWGWGADENGKRIGIRPGWPGPIGRGLETRAHVLAARPALDEAALGRAVSLLRDARRPLIWAGGGVVAALAWEELARLARMLGAGVITSPNGRGVIDEADPLCIGNLPWDKGVRALCQRADVMLAVGTRFQGPNTENWKMQLPEALIHIDINPEALGRCYEPSVGLVHDAREAMGTILTELDKAPPSPGVDDGWIDEVASVAAAARRHLRETLGPQAGLLDALEAVLDGDTVVVKDATVPAYTWGNRLLPVRRPGLSVMPNGFAIGLGLPHALGAAAADPSKPVVLLVGDGGFMLAATELATASAERLPIVVVLFNDGGYGILRNIQDRQYEARIGVDLGRPDFCGLACSLGAQAERVETVDDYRAAVARALGGAADDHLPRLVEVDLEKIGPMAVPFIGTSRPPAEPLRDVQSGSK
jgi:acetolactate synthase-1/2/3 large subunit